MTETVHVGAVPENSVIAELAEQAAGRDPIELVEGRIAFVLATGQRIEQIDLEPFAEAPTRKRGTVTVSDPDSFVTYVDRHSLQRATTLWGDADAGRIIAVLDDHASHSGADTPGDAGWGQHRASLILRQTEDWKHWLARDGQLLYQDAFAEHIEDGVDAIREPDAATMLELAQHFHAKSGASVSSGRRLGGEIQFSYEEQVTAKAGQKGNLEIPDTFILGLAPFDGNEPYAVTARLRFRLAEGQLLIGYRLVRPDKARRAAFDDVVAQVSAAADFPVMAGAPRS